MSLGYTFPTRILFGPPGRAHTFPHRVPCDSFGGAQDRDRVGAGPDSAVRGSSGNTASGPNARRGPSSLGCVRFLRGRAGPGPRRGRRRPDSAVRGSSGNTASGPNARRLHCVCIAFAFADASFFPRLRPTRPLPASPWAPLGPGRRTPRPEEGRCWVANPRPQLEPCAFSVLRRLSVFLSVSRFRCPGGGQLDLWPSRGSAILRSRSNRDRSPRGSSFALGVRSVPPGESPGRRREPRSQAV